MVTICSEVRDAFATRENLYIYIYSRWHSREVFGTALYSVYTCIPTLNSVWFRGAFRREWSVECYHTVSHVTKMILGLENSTIAFKYVLETIPLLARYCTWARHQMFGNCYLLEKRTQNQPGSRTYGGAGFALTSSLLSVYTSICYTIIIKL